MRNILQASVLMVIALLLPVVNVVAQSGPVDINSATVAQLAALPGIGPKRAAEIVKLRPFKDINDLTSRVKGISQKNLAKLTPMVTFGAAAPASSKTTTSSTPASTTSTTPTKTTSNSKLGKGVTPNADGSCPANAQIKGSRKGIYHLATGDANYAKTKARACFATTAEAEAAGYRAAKK
ncbi:MAG: helix-hairpin-helix domain-containing protein [Thermaceae bacterium]|nr:helix-hairpin-helix domain-containing protein [Thermaceae bacterium]